MCAFSVFLAGKFPLQYKLFAAMPISFTLPDTMQFFMNAVGHHWKHAIAKYIDSGDLAKSINILLQTKCSVVIDLQKVSKGHHIDAAKLPTLPGKQ